MVTLSPTATLRQRAAKLRREGVDVFDFSAGELDLPTPAHIVHAAIDAASEPENHHYGPTGGDDDLRQAIADRLTPPATAPLDGSRVLVTNGAKQALFNTFMTLLQPGDEVLIPAPYWVTFPSSVRLAGGRPVVVQPSTGALKVTSDDVEAARTPSTRALVLCSPNNPTGLVYDRSELGALLAWAAEHGVWIVSDETYVDLGFRPVPAPSRVAPAITDRLVTVGSVSKSFAMTGWRVGWMSGPKHVIDAATAVQSHTTSNVGRIAQAAALAALTGPDVTAGFRATLRERLSLCASVLEPLGLFQTPPDGAFYVFPDIRRFHPDDLAVADRLLSAGVVTVPGTSFGAPGHVRLSFAVEEAQLRHGLQIMADVLGDRDD
ncbi:pyridoxal phosphate-dependent aminotransferase [Streptomyces malaysiensis]|uniref:pyridoxal phosphate-dependent aminotransferase n=1 Tax=Streptomyces malaysiensis TaxID=92644 RepID=UPI003220978A|nr:pyridoxal phosphate-dependent aminotransferase [Streptomyces malaysiensis]